MPEFANIKYFTPIKNGAYDLNKAPASEFRLENARYDGDTYLIYPLYDNMTVGDPIIKDADYTIPTGTYICMFSYDKWPRGDVCEIISCERRENYSGRRRKGESKFSNYGVKLLTWDPPITGSDIIAAYHPPACPIFVKDKRINGLWVKQGQQIVKPSGVYVKQGGAIKKI